MGSHLPDLVEKFSNAKLSLPSVDILQLLQDYMNTSQSIDETERDEKRFALIDALKHAQCEYEPQEYDALIGRVNKNLSDNHDPGPDDKILSLALRLT